MTNQSETLRTGPVVLITGASSGIGQACAAYLSARGYRVYGTSRQPDDRQRSYQLLRLDVTDADSVIAAVEQVLEREGRIDALINNAGSGIAGAIETTSDDEARRQLETNFFGVFRMCRAVLPAMRRQGAGRIVNISSLGGLMGLPYQGFYSASKFAVEGFSEALYQEVRRFGIRVTLVDPGDFATGFTANRRPTAASTDDPVYREQFARTLQVIESDEQNGSDPQRIARLVGRILRRKNPRLRYTAGAVSQKFAAFLKRILPGGWFARILMGHYQISRN